MNKCELVYFWIDNYKNLNEFGVKLSPKHNVDCHYDGSSSVLSFNNLEFDKDKYSPFDEHNINITTIIGVNGSGKSNLLNAIGKITQKSFDNSYPNAKYCLVFYNGTNYIYKNSNNLTIKSLNNSMFPYDENIESDFRCLRFYPYFDAANFPIVTKNNYHNKEGVIQDHIRTYFYYDRLDEDITAFMLGRTINTLKKTKMFTDNPNLKFNEFRWEIDIKRAYDGIVHNFNNNFSDYRKHNGIGAFTSFFFPHSCNDLAKQFYTYIDRIVPFKEQKHEWKEITEDILPDLIFFGCVLQFLTYLEKIENFITFELENKADKKRLKVDKDYQQDFFRTREQILRECIKELIEYVIKDFDYNKIVSPEDFTKGILSIFDIDDWKYKQYFNSEELNMYYKKDFEKYNNLISNPKEYQKMFKDFFDTKNSTLCFKEDYNVSIDKFLQRKPGNDFSAIEVSQYSHLQNEAVDALIHFFPEPFLKVFFKINFLKKHSKGYYTFNSLSTGEQRIIRLFADIAYCVQYIRNLYILDEVDMTWHPEWQRKMITYLVDILKIINHDETLINLIIATHSPIVLSDIPADNIVLLEKDDSPDGNAKINSESIISTFGTNIHSLYMSPFALTKGAIGAFSQQYIRAVAAYLSENGKCIPKYDKKVESIIEAEKIINLLEDDVYKYYLLRALETKSKDNK